MVFAVDRSIVVSELLMYDQRVMINPFSLSDASVHESFTENESTLMTVKFAGASGTELSDGLEQDRKRKEEIIAPTKTQNVVFKTAPP